MLVQYIDHAIAKPPKKKEGADEGEGDGVVFSIRRAKDIEKIFHENGQEEISIIQPEVGSCALSGDSLSQSVFCFVAPITAAELHKNRGIRQCECCLEQENTKRTPGCI
jgi:hypothetical protein